MISFGDCNRLFSCIGKVMVAPGKLNKASIEQSLSCFFVIFGVFDLDDMILLSMNMKKGNMLNSVQFIFQIDFTKLREKLESWDIDWKTVENLLFSLIQLGIRFERLP